MSLGLELCFRVAREPELQEWIQHPNRKEKMRYSVTQDMLDAIDRFYFNHYCKSYRSGAFARAISSMCVYLGLYLDPILKAISKPYGKHARYVDVLHSSCNIWQLSFSTPDDHGSLRTTYEVSAD